MKNIWIKVTSILMFITGGVHSISLFFQIVPQNEIEKQMLDLFYSHKMESGAGFSPTLGDIFLALSSCFTLLYLMAGVLNFYLIQQKIEGALWRGILIIQLIFFGIAFIMMAFFTFLPPVILTGVTFSLLVISYFKISRT